MQMRQNDFKLVIYDERNAIQVIYNVCLIRGKALKWAKVSAIDVVIDLDLSPRSKNMYEVGGNYRGKKPKKSRHRERERKRSRTVCDSPVPLAWFLRATCNLPGRDRGCRRNFS